MAINLMSLELILQSFVSQTADIQGAALVSLDGLTLATSLPSSMDEERVAAMSAAMLSLGERICQELARGTIDRLFVEGNQGYAVLMGFSEDAVLLVLASSSVKQGLMMLEIKRLIAELKSTLN
ncbi:roadblock/LC7 domain-containing protein [Oculatella sp. LEGE 06141]|uniref:roadblock/LC7 domain-containing protein n=1 Tax=Oculatella sp. LEGE 06141 TaxID=1828648 RepID=UPI00187E9B04|nr:roadblock/LC7 domain-containing protein [Oculatella sp. LEGE 06141]MBE9181207.1 roadblock/LC7 domain-containing protein [Oculatella sp. LEGE 06141]